MSVAVDTQNVLDDANDVVPESYDDWGTVKKGREDDECEGEYMDLSVHGPFQLVHLYQLAANSKSFQSFSSICQVM